jgi:hypothetical protein
MTTYSEQQPDKQDAAEVKNYTRVPNMLIFGYHDQLSPQEKWLYVCLKHMCGKKGTRHLSLRYISEQTGISTGALSSSRNAKGVVNLGMMRHLHDTGIIHCEIKKHEGKGNPQYHVTITDVWALNQDFFITRSDFGQAEGENNNPSERLTGSSEFRTDTPETRSDFGQTCPNFGTNIRLDNKTTDSSKITKQDESNVDASLREVIDAPTPSFSEITEEPQPALSEPATEQPITSTPSQQQPDGVSYSPNSSGEKQDTTSKGKGRGGKRASRTAKEQQPALFVNEQEEAYNTRRRFWQERINGWRDGPLRNGGQCINETNALKTLVREYTDAQMDAIVRYIATEDFRYKKNPHKIGGHEMLEESRPAAAWLKSHKQWPDTSADSKIIQFPGQATQPEPPVEESEYVLAVLQAAEM